MKTQFFLGALALSFASHAVAEPNVDEKCFSVKTVQKLQKKSTKVKESRRDTLEMIVSARFMRKDDTTLFPKFYSRDGETLNAFEVSPDGEILKFSETVAALPEEAELCGEVTTVAGEEPKVGLNMGSDIVFQNKTGLYSLAELQDGVGDGKSWYKKLFPGPLALLVPKMTHVMIEFDEKNISPDGIVFTLGEDLVPMPMVNKFGGTYVIALKDIEASGADMLSVSGGTHSLSPVPSIKKMKSLGFGVGEPDEDSSDEKVVDELSADTAIMDTESGE